MDWALENYDPCAHPEYKYYDHEKFCGEDAAYWKAKEVEGPDSVELKR